MKFTQTNVAKIKAPNDGDVTIWDDEMKGFGVRFRSGGVGVYCIKYSVNGRQGKMTLGAVTNVLLADAKLKAHEHFALIANKVDPAIERAKRAADMVMFKDRINDYIDHLRKLGRTDKYVDDNKRSLGGDFGRENERKGYFAPLYRFSFKEITRNLVATELDNIEKDHGTGSKRDCRAHLNAYMVWAQQQGVLDFNVVEGTLKPETHKRDRILKPETEIIPVWHMFGDDDFGAIGKLLWLTWARRDEIGSLRKSEVDPKKQLIDLPPERVKNGIRHIIPLSKQAWAVLEPKLDQRDGEFVFGNGAGGYSGWDKAVNRLRDAVGQQVKDHFTLHDFRRTGRSLGVRRPVSIFPHIAEAILNHISSAESGKQGVAGVYDVNDPFQYHEEKTEALQKWADYLDDLTRPQLRIAA